MGKAWDDLGGPAAYQAEVREWGKAMMPLMFPGALIMTFGGTRTWHRLAAGMEDAGFEMWDTVMFFWTHAQGFPKAQDVGAKVAKLTGERPIGEIPNPAYVFMPTSGQSSTGWKGVIPETKQVYANEWQGYKNPALKPAWEPILCFRAPRNGLTYAELALKFGTGCLNVDGGRLASGAKKWDSPKGGIWHESTPGDQQLIDNPLGRYPTNLIFDEEGAKQLDQQSGRSRSRKLNPANPGKITPMAMNWGLDDRSTVSYEDEGGASRFFYVAKASPKERNAGCGDLPNDHPTVKPLDLCRHLASLLLPPPSVAPRRLWVPFLGSGSEMIGAEQAGWDEIVGVEQNAHFCEIANLRIKYWRRAPASPGRTDAA
jgi:site-specific DNA-methyltransferase (adenine-specific)